MTIGQAPLLEVADLTVEFRRNRRRPPLRAVDTVAFLIRERETVGLVGESGSGKSTIGRAILGLVPIAHGTISFRGEDISHASEQRRRALSAELQVVFQDPYSSLNPTRTIGQTLAETWRVHHHRASRTAVSQQVEGMLARVGLPADAAHRYPAHFSGGQRQRIAIARALIAQPRLVICDEPTSALDLSVQAQVLNLLQDLQDEFGLSYLFISHDLAVVRRVAHRIVVLYQGRIMEYGDAASLCAQPAHPYTQALLAAAPVPDPEEQRRRRLSRTRPQDFAQPLQAEDQCPFAARCPYAIPLCWTERPALDLIRRDAGIACHRWRELNASMQKPRSTPTTTRIAT